MAAVTAAGPAVPFLGPAILGGMFGAASAVPIATASIIINITIVPFTIFLLTMGTARTPATATASVGAAAAARKARAPSSSSISRKTFKKPLVWAPLLAFAIVLLNIHVPDLISHSFLMLGHASAGVALFAAGIVLAAYKVKLDLLYRALRAAQERRAAGLWYSAAWSGSASAAPSSPRR